MERCMCLLVAVAILSVSCGEGESLEEGGGGGGGLLLPSGILRDDILFQVAWPGLQPEDPVPGDDPHRSEKSSSGDDQEVAESSVNTHPQSLLPESSYDEARYVDIRTDKNEQYHCVLPEIHSFEMDQEDGDADEEEIRAETLLKTLSSKCTKLLMGYWAYELCHWRHIRQYHEPIRQHVEGKDRDEYYLGRYSKPKARAKADSSTLDLEYESETSGEADGSAVASKKNEEDIPLWYYNGEQYPYYEVEMTGGTPCDLKGDQPRSVTIRYICDADAHTTGTFLNIEEVTTCKYEATVSTTTLCQNRAYRLKENPVHGITCFSKGDSPGKPMSLHEHELSILKYIQGSTPRTKATPTSKLKLGKMYDSGLDEEEEEGREREGKGKYPSDAGVNRQQAVALDETFVRSFLSGELCLRGGSGWWQHEVCYGKHVKQIHEETGKDPVELLLGVWMEEGHQRWFSNAGHRKQGTNHVIHLYMNGDICDITKVARQCQVKFRCSKSARASQISLFLEEPTTCNYILTVEAAFLCPLVQNTDQHGHLIYPLPDQRGVSSSEEGGKEEYVSARGLHDSEDDREYDQNGRLKANGDSESEWDQRGQSNAGMYDSEPEWEAETQEDGLESEWRESESHKEERRRKDKTSSNQR